MSNKNLTHEKGPYFREDDFPCSLSTFKAAVIEQEDGPPLRLVSQGDFMTAMGMYYSGYIAKQHREQDTSA
jgi:hypothetical protein